MPWGDIEKYYNRDLDESRGAPAKSSRIALGALIIKEKLGLSDRETVDQILENPYLQYFLGFNEYQEEPPFDASMMVHFRKRLSAEYLSEINEKMILNQKEIDSGNSEKDDKNNPPTHKGKLLTDATCAPNDIRFPTDLSLLNEAREKSEAIIDVLHESLRGKEKKVRTYRKKARKQYLSVTKRKKKGANIYRKANRQQLGYLKRNLGYIGELSEKVSLNKLSRREYKTLLVITELHRQQNEMHITHKHSVSDRIVSISQPHVRPIVRGKIAASTEFGAKITVSLVDGMAYLDRLSWDNYNEGGDLIDQIEFYKKRFNCYPESVHADKIYRTRQNIKYCKELGVRFSGRPLGRPSKDVAKTKKNAKQTYQDEVDRIPIEGKFGQCKRRFGLGRIMAKLAQTSASMISLSLLVANLEKVLCAFILYLNIRGLLADLLHYFQEKHATFKCNINATLKILFLTKNKRPVFC